MNDTPAIQLKYVSKTYRVGKQTLPVLKNISLTINRGEVVAITGASGSGKSTLLHIIGGLDRPTTGEVIVDGLKIAKLSDRKLSNFRNRTLGFVFQSFYLQPFLNLWQNIALAAAPRRTHWSVAARRAKELANEMGLSEYLKHKPRELSGGQIQRAAIARALMNEPRVILADEPTGNLDSANSQSVIALLKSIRDKTGATVVIITHDDGIASQADRTLTLRDGVLHD